MGYIGSQPATNFETVRKQISTTNSGTTITLDYSVSSVQDILVTVNAVVQSYDNYSVSGTTLTLGGTLNNDRVEILYVGRTFQTVTPDTGTVTLDMLSASGTKSSSTFLRGDNTFASAGLSGWSENGVNNDLLPASASAGIYLGVNSATASNLLDDYEEGTWTPTFSNYSGTDQSPEGYYTKFGNLVIAGCRIGTDGTADASVAQIAGLPFTVRAGAQAGAIGGGLVSYTNGLSSQRWYGEPNTATVKCADGTGNDVNYNDFGANKNVRLVITYFV